MKHIWFACLFILMIAPVAAFATTRYADDDGTTNTGACTTVQSGPTACTWARALTQMMGGDTLILANGTYTYCDACLPNGSMGAPTILQAANQRQAIFRPASNPPGQAVFDVSGVSWWVIDGIVGDCGGGPTACAVFEAFPGVATNMVIKNSEAKNGKGAYGTGIDGSWVTSQFLNNLVHDNGGPGSACIDPGNQNSSTLSHGFYLGGSSHDNIIDGNDIYNQNCAYAITLYNGSSDVSNNIVRNNKIHNNPIFSVDLGAHGQESGNVAYNNIIYANGRGLEVGGTGGAAYANTIYNNGGWCIEVLNGGSGVQLKNNICLSNSSGAISNGGSGTVCTNNLNVSGCITFQGTTNPFVSAGTGDFHLASNINGGADLISIGITTDITGATRFTPPDIGAYEYLSQSVRYISTAGSDANSCDASKVAATPKQHFTGTAGAIACMGSSDILVVSSGTYAESLIDIIPAGVTIRASTANGPIVRPTSGTTVINLNHDDITLDGLDIDGVNVSGAVLSGAITGGAVSGAIIKNGTIRNGGGSCAITFLASTFQNNDIYDCGYDGIQIRSNSIVDGNRIRGTGDVGIIAYQSGAASDNNIIRNNVIYNNATAGLLVSGNANTVYNNISYTNGTGMIFFGGGTASRSYNNTFYANTGWCVNVDTGMQSTQIVNNICLSNELGAILDNGLVTTCTNNLNVNGCVAFQDTSNPFVNAAGANFHLTTDINGGTFLPSVSVDIDNVARGDPSDRGAYEFVGIGVTAGTSIFDVRGMR